MLARLQARPLYTLQIPEPRNEARFELDLGPGLNLRPRPGPSLRQKRRRSILGLHLEEHIKVVVES